MAADVSRALSYKTASSYVVSGFSRTVDPDRVRLCGGNLYATSEAAGSRSNRGVVGNRSRSGAGRHDRLRRRSSDRRRHAGSNRERLIHRDRRTLRAGWHRRQRESARWRDTRQPCRQDRDAGNHRYTHPSQPDARNAARRSPSPRVLWRGSLQQAEESQHRSRAARPLRTG